MTIKLTQILTLFNQDVSVKFMCAFATFLGFCFSFLYILQSSATTGQNFTDEVGHQFKSIFLVEKHLLHLLNRK